MFNQVRVKKAYFQSSCSDFPCQVLCCFVSVYLVLVEALYSCEHVSSAEEHVLKADSSQNS